MAYFLLYGLFALWVLFDGLSRRMGVSAALWAVGTAVLGPIILPIYLASRPLKRSEVREGGKAWNVLKNFAILWTIVMAIATVAGMLAVTKGTSELSSDAARAGVGIGMALGMAFLAAVWFFPTMGAALLGFLLKKNSIVETGPTGPLVGHDSTANAAGSWAGLVGVGALALIAVGVTSTLGTGTSPSATNSPAHSASASTDSTPPVAPGGWTVRQESNEMDGTKEAYISIDATNEIPGVIVSHRPTLTIQCRKHKPSLVINVGSPAQPEYGEYDSYAVRIKFDDEKPLAQRWVSATNNEAAFSPNPEQLIQHLSTTNTFLFEFTPFQRSATTAKFVVSGLKDKLETVQDACTPTPQGSAN